MKREIKFRVWTCNTMEYSIVAGKYGVFYVNPESKQDGLDPKDTASLTPNNTKYFDNIPMMQFTGLLDKNGKEIYEGDILKYRGKLSFNDPPFVVEWQNDDARWTEFYPSNNFEVIGNIYENPELLK